MKLSLLILAIFALPAFADTFTGKASYKKDYYWSLGDPAPSFDALEQLGVERAAEKAATQLCFQAGFSLCYVTSVNVTKCNYEGQGDLNVTPILCDAEAIAVGKN